MSDDQPIKNGIYAEKGDKETYYLVYELKAYPFSVGLKGSCFEGYKGTIDDFYRDTLPGIKREIFGAWPFLKFDELIPLPSGYDTIAEANEAAHASEQEEQ